MKLFQWTSSKKSNDEQLGAAAAAAADEVKVRDLVVYDNQRGRSYEFKYGEDGEDGEGNESSLTFGPHRESSRPFFYRTLNLKHLKNMYRNNHNFLPSRREDHAGLGSAKKDETAIVPHKYPPTSSSKDADTSKFNENISHQGERKKKASKMKELLRWGAASTNRGWKGSNLQSRAVLKAPSDYLSTSSSSKTSSRWDLGSCSTSSSMFSASSYSSASMWSRNLPGPVDNLQCSDRKDNQSGSPENEDRRRTGRWISTDTIFVVLELRK